MDNKVNPLGVEPVGSLMLRFAIPSIIAMLVGALYNIVDQLFIGQAVGTLGNAATNIAFPLSTSCIALALLFGIGGASCFNLTMGEGKPEKAVYYVGNAAFCLVFSGLVLALLSEAFLPTLLHMFGSPDEVMPYALPYVRITAIGFLFLIFTTGGGHLIRADGSPHMTMICNMTGAVINTILDAIFVFGFHWGMQGAALATIIGQIISAMLVLNYMSHYKTVHLTWHHVIPHLTYYGRVMKIGMASFFNQIAMMIMQIVMNNTLTKYGALSVYGASVPLACAGIVTKVSQVFFSIVIGIGQGSQPVESFNYGARQYSRVREAYRRAVAAAMTISVGSFLVFQLFPSQILGLFGTGTPEYVEFGVKFFRIFLFFIWLDALQPITSTFFTSIGKPYKGIFLSLTRQIIFFVPLILLLPLKFGVLGCVYSGPVADFLAAVITVIMAVIEFKTMRALEQNIEIGE